MTHSIYFDHNATTPVRAEVADAIATALALGGNASSVHTAGRQARQLVEESREQIADLVGVRPAEIVFTSGGTEANNLVLRGTGCDHVLVSAIEHDSVLDAAENIEKIPVDENGLIDLAVLETRLSEIDGQVLVSIMLANNETGVIEPVVQVVEIATIVKLLIFHKSVLSYSNMVMSIVINLLILQEDMPNLLKL